MLAIIAAGVVLFAVTDLDDLIVLTALFGSREIGTRRIVAGQFLGIAALIAVSAIAAVGLLVVPDHRIGLLGIIPLALGVRGLLRAQRGGAAIVTSAGGVAALTIANGADNVSVYTPLFREAGSVTVAYVIIFAVMTGVWLALGAFLASRKPVVAMLDRGGRWIVPLVYVGIGIVLIAGAISS